MKNEPRGAAILVVDDDASLASTLKEFLSREGYHVEMAQSAAEALAVHAANPRIALALVDLIMPVTDGLALTDELRRRNPDITVVIMTGYGTIETAVDAIKRGAEDYVTKPFDYEAVRKKVARLMEVNELRERVSQLEKNLERHPSFENIVSLSPAMERVIERARLASGSDASVLILGETGTGKEMLARAIHAASSRSRAPFVPLNCGALPHDLVESELFGFRRGAFTGAHADAPGIFSAASGGTVFLDELGEMPKDVQVKLLRVLQEREYQRLGSSETIKADIRVIAATNCDLTRKIEQGTFREDLYYRLNVVPIQMPPLRQRPEDIPALAAHFVEKICALEEMERKMLPPEVVERLCGYFWPGNVRQLENAVEMAIALSGERRNLMLQDFPLPAPARACVAVPGVSPVVSVPDDGLDYEQTLALIERSILEQALRKTNGNKKAAAEMLRLKRTTLAAKVRSLDSLTVCN